MINDIKDQAQHVSNRVWSSINKQRDQDIMEQLQWNNDIFSVEDSWKIIRGCFAATGNIVRNWELDHTISVPCKRIEY